MEYFKFAFVKSRITPVLTKDATNIVVIIELVFKLRVSNPIVSMRDILSFLMTILIIEIKIVTELASAWPNSWSLL